MTFTPGDRAESVRFVALTDDVKELNETVSLMLQVVDDGGIDVELCPQSTTVVTIFDISSELHTSCFASCAYCGVVYMCAHIQCTYM